VRLLIAQFFVVVTVSGGVIFAAPLAQRFTTSQPMPQCQVGQWPDFNFGFAALRLDLGADMGDAVECEHATTALGDTDQQTTTGMAHYDRASNTPSFHVAGENWALTLKGLVFWPGSDAQVPPGLVAVPSPGSARLASAAGQNSKATGGVLGGGTRVTAPASVGTAFLSASQIASVASLLGIKSDKVQSMSVDDLSTYTQQSGGSVAEVTRTINTETH
jgi:hypothetical protein